MDQFKDQMNQVALNLWHSLRARLEEQKYLEPVVVLLYEDGRQEFLYPRFGSESERQEAFRMVNRHIKDTQALGAVMAMETWFHPKDHGRRREAILMQKRGWGIREHEAWLYDRDPSGEIVWDEFVGPDRSLDEGYITAFQEVH